MKADTIDFFVEDVRFAEGIGWQYRRGEAWYEFTLRRETVHGKGVEPLATCSFTRTNSACWTATRISTDPDITCRLPGSAVTFPHSRRFPSGWI